MSMSRLFMSSAVSLVLLALGCGDGSDFTAPTWATTYSVTFGVTDAVGELGAIAFTVEFLGTSGGWVGAGTNTSCNVVEGNDALSAFNDTGGGSLRVGIIWPTGLATPGSLATCLFKSHELISNDLFRIEVTAAGDEWAEPIVPLPTVAIVDIQPVYG